MYSGISVIAAIVFVHDVTGIFESQMDFVD
jgi:hypothetical protein